MKAAARGGPVFKFGVQVPQTLQEALRLDKVNNNSKWQEAINAEIEENLKAEQDNVTQE